MKWTVLGESEYLDRYVILSQALNEKGVTNQFEVWPHPSLNFETFEEIAPYQHVRLSRQWALTLAKNIKLQSSWTSLLGVADGMVNTPSGWWPLCALYESFGELLKKIGSDLETAHSALIAGSGAAARIAVAALFKAGFRKFLVTNVNDSEGEDFIKEVRRRFFGLTITFIPREKVVLLPGETTILVNCTPTSVDNPLLPELCYLNFLKRPGIMIDLSLSKTPNLLMAEASDSGVQVLNGIELAVMTDVIWAKWAFKTDLDPQIYRDLLNEKLKV